jgi:branched-chain amino acid transport system substrate-binding protein
MSKSRTGLRALALTAALASSTSLAVAQAEGPIKIGFVTELTGPWSFFGTSCVAGLKLAEANLNPPGKRKIEFIITDNQTNPAQAVAAARSLDVQDKVLALSGPTSSDVALAMYGYAEQTKLPFVVPIAAFPQLTKPGTRYTFRVEPSAVGWGYAMARFIEQRKPKAKVAIIYSDYALFRAIAAGFKYQAEKSGLQIVSDVVFPQGASDATVQSAQVLAAAPDYVISTAPGAFDNTLTNQLIDIGIKPEQIIHPFGAATNVFGWGKRSVGSFYGTFFDINLEGLTGEAKTFIDNFTTQNKRPPSYAENFCYITAQTIRQAIDSTPGADSDREKFRGAMSKLKTKESTTGVPVEFDQNGARKEYIYFVQLQDVGANTYKGKQVFFTEWDPEVIPVYSLVK